MKKLLLLFVLGAVALNINAQQKIWTPIAWAPRPVGMPAGATGFFLDTIAGKLTAMVYSYSGIIHTADPSNNIVGTSTLTNFPGVMQLQSNGTWTPTDTIPGAEWTISQSFKIPQGNFINGLYQFLKNVNHRYSPWGPTSTIGMQYNSAIVDLSKNTTDSVIITGGVYGTTQAFKMIVGYKISTGQVFPLGGGTLGQGAPASGPTDQFGDTIMMVSNASNDLLRYRRIIKGTNSWLTDLPRIPDWDEVTGLKMLNGVECVYSMQSSNNFSRAMRYRKNTTTTSQDSGWVQLFITNGDQLKLQGKDGSDLIFIGSQTLINGVPHSTPVFKYNLLTGVISDVSAQIAPSAQINQIFVDQSTNNWYLCSLDTLYVLRDLFVTGIFDPADAEISIKAFPNPTTDKVQIVVPKSADMLVLYSINGSVLSVPIEKTQQGELTVFTASLVKVPSGIYVGKVIKKNKQIGEVKILRQ